MTVPTLTLHEAVIKLREAGIQTSEKKMGAGLEQKVYPFGVCIIIDGNRNFEIYEKLLTAYLAERAESK